MKNENKSKLVFSLFTVFAVLLFVKDGWSQSGIDTSLPNNKTASLAFVQPSNENSGQIQRVLKDDQSSSNYITDMKEVQFKQDTVNVDSVKTHLDSLTAFRKYWGTGLPHVMDSNGTFGGFISLDDGSLWVIDPRDIYSAIYWDPMAIIFVQLDNDPFSMGYNYVLINNNNDEAVHAMYIGGR